MNKQIPAKTCKICGKIFTKPPNVHRQAWVNRETCGMVCGHVLRWNREGRKPKSICPTCGKLTPKPKMKYCSFACRTPRRKCAWCGKIGRIRPSHKFCSWKCAVESSRTPVQTRRCEFCGKIFEHKPNPITKGRFCSSSCGGKYNLEHRIVPDPLSAEQTAARIAGVSRSPISGPFVTHWHAMDWFLVSPKGQTFKIHNLKLFIREKATMFTAEELEVRSSGQQPAYSGLASLKPVSTRKRIASVWHDWRWWHEGENCNRDK